MALLIVIARSLWSDWTALRFLPRRICDATRAGSLVVLAAIPVVLLTAFSYRAPSPIEPRSPDGQWWFTSWGIADQVWPTGALGQGVTVAVLDTGVDVRLDGLAEVTLAGANFANGSDDGRVDHDSESVDAGHGTRMAALISGQGRGGYNAGIAPSSRILPVTVAPSVDPAKTLTSAIGWAVGHGAKVINISQAAPALGVGQRCPVELQAAVGRAIESGSIVVAGAGNSGSSNNEPVYPAACKGVLAVGAVDIRLHAWADTQRQSYVDVAAFGVHMRSSLSNGRLVTASGTSDAAALTSAAVALVWSAHPELTNRQVVARLLATTVDDRSTPGHDNATGYGIIRPYHAIVDNIPADAPNPVFDELKALPSGGAATGGSGESSGPPATVGGSSPGQTEASSGFLVAPVVVWGAGVIAVVVLIGVVVAASRRRRPAPPGWPPPGGAPVGAPPPGWPPPGGPPQAGTAPPGGPPGQAWPPPGTSQLGPPHP